MKFFKLLLGVSIISLATSRASLAGGLEFVDRGDETIDECLERLLGDPRAVPHRERAHAARIDRYVTTREAFLDTFADGIARDLARESLVELEREADDALALDRYETLLRHNFARVHGHSFLLLGLTFLNRAEFFDDAKSMVGAMGSIAQSSERRKLSSAERSMLLLHFVANAYGFQKSSLIVEAMRIVFDRRALDLHGPDLLAVVRAVDALLVKRDPATQQAVVALSRDFVREWEVRRGN